MDHAVADLQPQTLGYRRCTRFQLEGDSVLLAELTALDADQVWAFLSESEKSGKIIEAYVQVVLRGAVEMRGGVEVRTFTIDEVRALPARLVVEMAETIMDLTGLGLEAGKVEAGEAETPS